ncbi:MAG: hypothetical protein Q7V57_19605 [Actinomycetota bacterium]|nr:hypothetical protein [Actinomycetota bacterium]
MSVRQQLGWLLRGNRQATQALQSLTLELRALQQRVDQLDRGTDELRTVLNDAIDDLAGRTAALNARIDAS